MVFDWAKEIENPVTICDETGIIIYMNLASANQFENYGGVDLIGSNLLDCHPEPSKSKLTEMLKKQTSNSYIIEKNGKQKLIHQTPWYEEGKFKGLVEVSIRFDGKIPTFKR